MYCVAIEQKPGDGDWLTIYVCKKVCSGHNMYVLAIATPSILFDDIITHTKILQSSQVVKVLKILKNPGLRLNKH